MNYTTVIGLEVHAELSTKTKIYCSCKNSFGSEVNSNCCPNCTGMPGSLPTLNEKVVEYSNTMASQSSEIAKLKAQISESQGTVASATGRIFLRKFSMPPAAYLT